MDFCSNPLRLQWLAVPDAEGIASFGLLQRVSARPESRLMYLVFDLLCLNEEDIKGAPLVGRRGILRKLFPNGYDL